MKGLCLFSRLRVARAQRTSRPGGCSSELGPPCIPILPPAPLGHVTQSNLVRQPLPVPAHHWKMQEVFRGQGAASDTRLSPVTCWAWSLGCGWVCHLSTSEGQTHISLLLWSVTLAS